MDISKGTQLLKKFVMGFIPSISSERAEIITKYYKDHEYEMPIIKRAKALEKILKEKTIYINENELIVGNLSVRPRCAEIYPEFSVRWILKELDEFDKRDSDVFRIDENTKARLRELLPYWQGRCIEDKAVSMMPAACYNSHKEFVYILTSLGSGLGHIAVDYEKCIKFGLRKIIDEAKALYQNVQVDSLDAIDKKNFYSAVITVCEAAIAFARRYSDYALELAETERDERRKRELLEISRICRKVPEFPAESFHEALQSFWFVHLIIHIESNGHSISPGRFDQYIYPYYVKDIENNLINREQARVLLENLWIKFNEIMKVRDKVGSKAFGGYPMFQNLIVGGVDENGNDTVNELSYLCIEVTRKLKLPQPSLSVRWHTKTPISFMKECVKLVKAGIGMPAFFNDEVIIPILINMGCSLSEARNYAEVGCVEPQVPGKTEGFYSGGFLNLCKVMEITMNNGVNPLTGNKLGLDTGEDFKDFDSFYNAFQKQLTYFIGLQAQADNIIDYVHSKYCPTPFVSCFVDKCIASGKDVREGGAKYNYTSPNAVGLANVADAMAVVKYCVFRDKLLSYSELKKVLKDNFESNEILRMKMLNDYPKYGNDDDDVDYLARDIAKYYCSEVRKIRNVRGGYFQPGLQSISAHALFVNSLGATADGRKAEMLVSDGGCSPAQGRDRKGPTAVFNSVAKLDHYSAPNGALLNLKLNPSLLENEQGERNLISLIETYFMKKGQHVQFNVVSADVLRDAQKHPENYSDLVVRVAGFSVYFTTIDKVLQEDIIARTEQCIF